MTDTKKTRTPKQDCIYVLINGAIRIPVKPLDEASLSDAKTLLAKIKDELQDTLPFGSEITFSDPKTGKMEIPPKDAGGASTLPVNKKIDVVGEIPEALRRKS